jgi:hypothetical protein
MNVARFKPWIGSEYGRDDARRIMILGESCYDDGNPDADEWRKQPTRNVVAYWMAGARAPHLRFFTRIDRSFTGALDYEVGTAFNKVIFYNFIQEFLQTTRQAPTEQMARDSDAAFFEILEHEAVTHVIVCGYRLWELLPGSGTPQPPVLTNGSSYPRWRYEHRSGAAECVRLKHPSASNWSYDDWVPALRAFLR